MISVKLKNEKIAIEYLFVVHVYLDLC